MQDREKLKNLVRSALEKDGADPVAVELAVQAVECAFTAVDNVGRIADALERIARKLEG